MCSTNGLPDLHISKMSTMSYNNISPRSRPRYPSPPNAKEGSRVSPPSAPPHPHTGVVFRSANKEKDEYQHEQEERKKYLTAKYPKHQMSLIRKRLEVEDWIDERLKELYDVEDDTDSYDCEIDLDDLLDLEVQSDRRNFIQERLVNIRKSHAVVNNFIEQLLEKASTL